MKRLINKANVYYAKFGDYARKVEDYFGSSIALNRQAINFFRMNDPMKALEFHLEYLELLSDEHSFVGLYNIGLCLRVLGKYSEAIRYFEDSKKWAEVWHVK